MAVNVKGLKEPVYTPHERIQSTAHVKSMEQYKNMYQQSIEDPESFWKDIASQFFYKSEPTGKFLDYNFNVNDGPIYIKWMDGAKTNISYNCLDRHVAKGHGDKIAYYW